MKINNSVFVYSLQGWLNIFVPQSLQDVVETTELVHVGGVNVQGYFLI